ncbi:MAG: T9SS type B sorting domain-containing protein, partial [Bacteroidia bacterium]|nr:T9SS type B sorting domain-containing protein [Bacteroidia bacterium]
DDIEVRLCVPPTSVIISPNDTVCKNQTVTLEGQFTNDGTFTEPLTYKWFKSATASYNQSDWTEVAIGQTLTISSAQSSDAGFYRVAVASAGSIDLVNCRSMSDIVSLTVQDCQVYFLVVSEDTAICSGSSVELQASGAVSYSWSPAIGLSSTTIANPIASPTTTTTYTVTGTMVNSSTLSDLVTVFVLANTTTELKDTICLNDSYVENGFNLPVQTEAGDKIFSLNLLSQNGCDSIVQLNLLVLPKYETARQVFIEQGESIQIDNKTYSFPTEVTSRYMSVSGCDSVIITTINWKYDSSECDELIPDKYFSPNNDNIQDTWNIKNIECYEDYVVEIFDRFSKLLIRYDGNFTPWNGIYSGHPEPATDYWYVIT